MTNNKTIKIFNYRPLTAAISICLGVSQASANPTGGNVVAGQANISNPTATQTVIQQSSDKAIINWNQFNIKANEHTRFIQPSVSSITLNRVTGKDPSAILGQLSANGKIVLINPNGIIFGQNSRVDVAALITSTHDIKDEDFMAGKLNFTIPGKPGAQVINQGTITIKEGGLVALVAPSVTNSGMIQARLGKIVLAAANSFTLDLYGDDLILFEADSKITNQLQDVFGNPIASALENSGTIDAYSGYVLLTTDVAKNVVDKAINMTGIIKAQSAENKGGTIILNANVGKTAVSGILDASASVSGDGGFIETSGSIVDIDPNAVINTSAESGNTGTWLLDPTDYYIAASGGDITGTALSGFLGQNNVIVQTATTGSDNGDIYVNDSVSWSNSNKLTLTAYRNININQVITNSGGGSVELRSDNTGTSIGTVVFGNNGFIRGSSKVDLFYNPSSYSSPTNFAIKVSAGIPTSYMLVNDVNQLQAINTNLTGTYALGKDIDASATSLWNSGKGFTPIGNVAARFNGLFEGKNLNINGLTINRSSDSRLGLFGYAGSSAKIKNLNLKNVSITGFNYIGSLVGVNSGVVTNTSATGSVRGLGTEAGGLIGTNYYGRISNSYSAVNVVGNSRVGGLVGWNGWNGSAIIDSSYSTGNVSGTSFEIGGLVGTNYGSVVKSFSTSKVTASGVRGGLVAWNAGTVSNSYWDTQSSGQSSSVGGIGKTTVQMKQQATYSGWDFTNTWNINNGVSYPVLAWQASTQTPSAIVLSSTQSINVGETDTNTNELDNVVNNNGNHVSPVDPIDTGGPEGDGLNYNPLLGDWVIPDDFRNNLDVKAFLLAAGVPITTLDTINLNTLKKLINNKNGEIAAIKTKISLNTTKIDNASIFRKELDSKLKASYKFKNTLDKINKKANVKLRLSSALKQSRKYKLAEIKINKLNTVNAKYNKTLSSLEKDLSKLKKGEFSMQSKKVNLTKLGRTASIVGKGLLYLDAALQADTLLSEQSTTLEKINAGLGLELDVTLLFGGASGVVSQGALLVAAPIQVAILISEFEEMAIDANRDARESTSDYYDISNYKLAIFRKVGSVPNMAMRSQINGETMEVKSDSGSAFYEPFEPSIDAVLNDIDSGVYRQRYYKTLNNLSKDIVNDISKAKKELSNLDPLFYTPGTIDKARRNELKSYITLLEVRQKIINSEKDDISNSPGLFDIDLYQSLQLGVIDAMDLPGAAETQIRF